MSVSTSAIKKILREKFTKITRDSLEFVAVNLTSVALGIKPSFLVERIPFNTKASFESRSNLLCLISTEINKICGIEVSLGVFSVLTSDFVVYNKQILTKRLDERCKESSVLVDVSPALSQPEVVDGESNVSDLIGDLIDQLDLNRDNDCFELKCSGSWNITTLFGILLDYPTIYFYRGLSFDGTCLDQKDLKSFKLCLTINGYKSEIYSFSYPLALDSFLSSYVHDWRTKIFQNFSYLELSWTQKIVNLDCIVL